MGAILDRLLAMRGETVSTLRRTGLGRTLRRNGVMVDSEFLRIDALPRRVWHDDPTLPEKAALLTEYLRQPTGTQVLWPIQAAALYEASDNQGLTAGVRVSGGKTLVSLLAASVPGLDHLERPVLFVPAKHREKTARAYDVLSAHWRLHPQLTILTYEELSDVRRHEWLLRYQPQLVICDEAHKLKSPDSARRLRFDAFIREYPHTVQIHLSGTFMRKSVHELRAVGEWTLHERSPVPRVWKIADDWDSVLNPAAQNPLAPGALATWCDDSEAQAGMLGVRQAFGRRLAETPGVIISNGVADIAASLTIHVQCIAHPAVDDAMRTLRSLWELPDGWTIRDAPVYWEVARQLAEGFYYRVDPRPPQPWLDARKAWHRLCSDMQADSDADLVSELMVKQACAAMGDSAPAAYRNWLVIEPSFVPNRVATWLSDAIVDRVTAWLVRNPGIAWIEHTALGERIQERTGVPYFGSGALAKSDAYTGSLLHYQGRNAVCQILSCAEGFDLQHHWSRNLIVTPHPAGTYWEQLLARTHRYGQQADTVTCEVWCKCREDLGAVECARAEEMNVAAVFGDAQRKLVIADWLQVPTSTPAGPAWNKASH